MRHQIRKYPKVLASAAFMAIVATSVAIGFNFTRSNQNFSGILNLDYEKTLSHVQVTLTSIETIDNGLQLKYSFMSTTGNNVFPIGVPSIQVGDGTKVEASSTQESFGSEFVDQTWRVKGDSAITFPTGEIPRGESLVVNLDSFVTFDSGNGVATLDLSEASSIVDPDGDDGDVDFTLGGPEFSIGAAVYKIEGLQKRVSGGYSVITIAPVNETATRTELGSGPSELVVSEIGGNVYKRSVTYTKWSSVSGERRISKQFFAIQDLLPSRNAVLALAFEGIGPVAGPFEFEINLSETVDSNIPTHVLP